MAARATATRDDARAETTTSDHRNDVLLVGRVTSPAAERTLPSGDVLVTWRIVVDRPPRARSGERRSPTVDTLDCVAWRADVRRTAATWSVGDTVELNGSLRRRFWRATSGSGEPHRGRGLSWPARRQGRVTGRARPRVAG